MWHIQQHGIRYVDGPAVFTFPFFQPDWKQFSGEVVFLEVSDFEPRGYDEWTQSYDRYKEISFLQDIIDSLRENPRRIHVRGLSCAESFTLLADYYTSQGYYNSLLNSYTLPTNTLITVSVSLRHVLFCEKDKKFLSSLIHGHPYYLITPPVRSSSELRCIQQAARSGLLATVEVFGEDVGLISQVFEKQILSVFQAVQLFSFRWGKYGFVGSEEYLSFSVPDFIVPISQQDLD